MQQSSTSIRLSLRLQRNNISNQLRVRYDLSINKTLLDTGILLRSPRIASYIANDGEPSLNLFIQSCAKFNTTHLLPVVHNQQLLFSPYAWGEPLVNNAFNILEPAQLLSFPINLLSIILMPLVGFDTDGNRLGMGAGFYDRTLKSLANPLIKRAPLLIGVAYSVQQVDTLNRQPWDIPLDAVVTEKELICFTPKASSLLRAS